MDEIELPRQGQVKEPARRPPASIRGDAGRCYRWRFPGSVRKKKNKKRNIKKQKKL